MKNNYLNRAVGAKMGIYGNSESEAYYFTWHTDAAGQPLSGATNRYVLRFAKRKLPPVNAFWSLTMYDGKTQLLVANPINRYLINSPMLPQLKFDPDGSLPIYIQKDSPGGETSKRTGCPLLTDQSTRCCGGIGRNKRFSMARGSSRRSHDYRSSIVATAAA